MNDQIEIHGNVGNYIHDGNVISFQLGTNTQLFEGPSLVLPSTLAGIRHEHQWLSIGGYQVLMRGFNDLLIDEITKEIKENRLLPRLYGKQIKMLYGHGPMLYTTSIEDNKLRRQFVVVPEVQQWLESWEQNGLQPVDEFCRQNIKNFYYFGDFFCKWRFTRGKRIGMGLPLAGLEALENKHCRLATLRKDVATEVIPYSDFRFIAYGRWFFGGSGYRIYPKFSFQEVANIQYAAISHHRDKSVDEYYGVNETHQGARPYIQGSNKTAHYINSFLKNSLAAKIHIIVPNAWLESKRTQIQHLCDENKRRKIGRAHV